MINFFSTFPPIKCGIGTYTKYLTSMMPKECWKVVSFELNKFLMDFEKDKKLEEQVEYIISLKNPELPNIKENEVLWFQHAFGMWGGKEYSCFYELLKQAKQKKKKVIISLHTIHFQSTETSFGLQEKEKKLLYEILPFIDAVTVFSNGAYKSVINTCPEYKDKVVVLRHGVHLYPEIDKNEAKKILLKYLINQFKQIQFLQNFLFEDKTILIGNLGFVTFNKAPFKLYELREILQSKLPDHKIIAIYIGTVQQRKDKNIDDDTSLLEKLKDFDDGKENLFFEKYLPEEILPIMFRALDFAEFWSYNATQSGRLSHAQGTKTCVVGRDIEGIGETLKLCQLPVDNTLEGLAEKIKMLILNPELKEKILKINKQYAEQFSYKKQAQKHLMLAEIVKNNGDLPVFDRIF